MMQVIGFAIGAAIGALLFELPKTLIVVGRRRSDERRYRRLCKERVEEAMSKPVTTSDDPLYSPGLRGERAA